MFGGSNKTVYLSLWYRKKSTSCIKWKANSHSNQCDRIPSSQISFVNQTCLHLQLVDHSFLAPQLMPKEKSQPGRIHKTMLFLKKKYIIYIYKLQQATGIQTRPIEGKFFFKGVPGSCIVYAKKNFRNGQWLPFSQSTSGSQAKCPASGCTTWQRCGMRQLAIWKLHLSFHLTWVHPPYILRSSSYRPFIAKVLTNCLHISRIDPK